MKIFADVAEAADRLEELIDLARRGDTVLICRQAKPVAELSRSRSRLAPGIMSGVWQPKGVAMSLQELHQITTTFTTTMDCLSEYG
ncbi:antitoxin (DNA-binding transcriptional repressor) of toxin-antitoxin stability system [Pseudorhizobium tarimense]|uniref:Antitoxin (DNA-binding transcriptional repressor) of toxin-antitoxin stability system n=1 Tax=Pseudorhizobium tarimense TaxID=1079109 RepID=A0ABV2HE13_9HYPH